MALFCSVIEENFSEGYAEDAVLQWKRRILEESP